MQCQIFRSHTDGNVLDQSFYGHRVFKPKTMVMPFALNLDDFLNWTVQSERERALRLGTLVSLNCSINCKLIVLSLTFSSFLLLNSIFLLTKKPSLWFIFPYSPFSAMRKSKTPSRKASFPHFCYHFSPSPSLQQNSFSFCDSKKAKITKLSSPSSSSSSF